MLSTLRCRTVPAAARLVRRSDVARSLCTAVRPVTHRSRAAALSWQYTAERGCASGQDGSFEFKAETRKLLDIVAKSLYTDKEVFIRELISNASDACEKLRYLQSTQIIKDVNDEDAPLCVKIRVDEQARQFIIEDTGLGMTREELIENLGTIAKSGSLEFLQSGNTDADKIIGQFGVGFYSTFVVADKVEVFTKTADKEKGEQGYLWSSDGSGTYTITESPDAKRGTKIVLTLKDDVAEFAQTAAVKKAATKFSSYIDFPLYILEEAEEKELNKQEALWMKQSASPEEHTEFFRYLNGSSYGEPYYSFLYQTDAPLSIKTCFYIPDPDNAPSRLFTRDPELGVSLHSRRVLVKKQADGVMPKWLHWVKGVVDCEDMPMNISRENMQDTRLMAKLSMAVVRRILRFLNTEAKKDGEKYNKFFKAYSYYLKAGVIEDKEANNSRHKDDLMKLMRFESSNGAKGEVISLEEYLENAKDGQNNIYYFCAPDRQTALSSPYLEQFIKRGRNVLFMYDDIDEFVVSSIEAFKASKFVSVDSHDKDFELDLDQPEEEDLKDTRVLSVDEQKELDTFVKGVLKEKVQEVKFTDRLVSSPAVVTSMLTPQMRKMMKQMMAGREETGMNNIPVTLELSAKHHVITTLFSIKDSNEVVARMAVEQLYDNACIAAGTLEDPRTLLARLNKVLEMTIYQGAGFDYATNEYISRPAATPAESSKQLPNQEPKATDDTKVYAKPDAKFEEVKTDAKFEEVKSSTDGKGAEVKKP